MEYDEFRAMNSAIVLAAEGKPAAVARGFAQARAFIVASEARFTRFSDESELARLNRAAGAWFRASEDLFEVVRLACAYAEQTEGLFDPTILDALERAGYDRSMDGLRAVGAGLRRAEAPLARHSAGAIRFDEAARAIRLPPGVRLDLGGIAKGWIAERAARVLAGFLGACAVSAGGDLFTIGLPAEADTWPVALEDPRDERNTLAILRVGPGAVATSSVTKRRWRQGERTQHHLIDPRRGAPAETDWLGVTVLAPHAATAEVFAKAILIGGAGAAARIAARCTQEIEFITVDRAGQLWGSRNARRFLDVGVECA